MGFNQTTSTLLVLAEPHNPNLEVHEAHLLWWRRSPTASGAGAPPGGRSSRRRSHHGLASLGPYGARPVDGKRADYQGSRLRRGARGAPLTARALDLEAALASRRASKSFEAASARRGKTRN